MSSGQRIVLRDLRDPQTIGEEFRDLLLSQREWEQAWGAEPMSATEVVDAVLLERIPDYDGSWMSNDPAQHHSKVKQDAYIESDGGE